MKINKNGFQGYKNIKNGLDDILRSNNIRILIKIFLELGNLINTNYCNNRRIASSFKIKSLLLTKNYRSPQKDKSLLKFVADSAKPRLKNINKELDELENLKKEDFGMYKDVINEFLLDYRKFKDTLVDFDEPVKRDLKSFFLYFSDYVKNFQTEYRETTIYSSIIKRKFCELEEKSIKEIINSLYEFIKLIKEEIEK